MLHHGLEPLLSKESAIENGLRKCFLDFTPPWFVHHDAWHGEMMSIMSNVGCPKNGGPPIILSCDVYYGKTNGFGVATPILKTPGQHGTPMVLYGATMAYPPVNMEKEHASFLHSPIKREMLPLQHLSPNLSSFIYIYICIVYIHIHSICIHIHSIHIHSIYTYT